MGMNAPVMSAEARATVLEHGLDPDDAYVRYAVAEAGFLDSLVLNPPPHVVKARLAALCPISDDYPLPGEPSPPTPPGHCRGPVGDRVESKYPFGKLAMGSSFALPPRIDAYAVRSAANYFSIKTGCKFRFRRGRCWRWW